MDLVKYWKEKALKANLTVEELKQYCNQSLLVWTETHRIINGDPFSLTDYPYMEDIYADMYDEIVALKSAQSAFSEWFVNIMLWLVDTNKGNPYFVFPTMKDVGIFVQGRVDKAIEETPYLYSQLRGKTDNVSLKRYGNRNMYFTGSQKRTQIISSPADAILEDEYDEHNPDVHDTVEKRLNNSKLKWKRRISTPTYPGQGIHSKFQQSDQRCWFVKCPYCKQEIRVSGDDIDKRWELFILENPSGDGTYIYCCPECKSPQFNPASSEGYWKVTHPENKIHGYSVNRLMTKTCSAEELFNTHKKALINDTIAEFYRSDLGIPYQPIGSRIYTEDVHACAIGKRENMYSTIKEGIPGHKYYMGADTGKNIHVTIIEEFEGRLRIVCAEQLSDYSIIPEYINKFHPLMCIIDNRPEPSKVVELRLKYNIIKGAEHSESMVKPTNLSKDESIIFWNKYFSIERFYNMILSQGIGIPMDLNTVTDGAFYRHLTTFMRKDKIDTQGNKRRYFAQVGESTKKAPDHYLFSSIFALAARDAYNEIMSQIKTQDCGFIII